MIDDPSTPGTVTPAPAAPHLAHVGTDPLAMLSGAALAVVGFVFAIAHVVYNAWILLDPRPGVALDSIGGRALRFLDGTGPVAVFIALGLMLWPDRTTTMLGRIVFGIWVLGSIVAVFAEQRLGYPGAFGAFMR